MFRPLPKQKIEINQASFEKLKDNFERINLINASIFIELGDILEQPRIRIAKKMAFFTVMVTTQIIKIIEEND